MKCGCFAYIPRNDNFYFYPKITAHLIFWEVNFLKIWVSIGRLIVAYIFYNKLIQIYNVVVILYKVSQTYSKQEMCSFFGTNGGVLCKLGLVLFMAV